MRQVSRGNPERGRHLLERLDEVRIDLATKGFCRGRGEVAQELAGVAVLMRSRIDGLTLAFACSVLSFNADDARLDDLGMRLVAVVRNVEASLGIIPEMSRATFDLDLPARKSGGRRAARSI